MKNSIFIYWLTLLGLAVNSSVVAQSFSFEPNLARMDNEKIGVGVDFEMRWENEYTITTETGFPRYIEFDMNINGTVLSKPALNPNHQHLDLYFGYLVSFKKAQELQIGQEPGPSKDYGALGLGINANFEANQTFTEQNVELGTELRYTNSSKKFLPVVELSYLFVTPVRSDFREVLNTDNNLFQRFDARAFWAVRFGPFLLNPDFRYFRSLDLAQALKENGLDEGLHTAISLGYVFEERDSGLFHFFEYLYLQYNRGQFPVYLDSRETIEAGITFLF
ncbi:hypothetical protein LQ318_08315 [Aliifodinibius salicampi]|uniref:MetA-pathway of phenol degradation n=1 Tax=Fodinibius salicampi TaxID=1920655 RepID=A0ABT3PYH3_9BACT|nr:hypothetical protein [Fodinibius salicampi]MCW9712907.1 hypothetical protein [Fodinibius salicampi]